MNKEIIEKAFDNVLDDFSSKCGRVSRRASVGNAFKRVSEKYGLSLKTYEVERTYRKKKDDWDDDYWHFQPVYKLYDKEHNTSLVFTERFLDENNIAFNSKGNHKNHTISLDELIEGYLKLPKKSKDSVNQVIFKYMSDARMNSMGGKIFAYSQFEDSSAKEMNTITLLSYYFDKDNNYNPTGDGWSNYDFLLAHESVHCIDFRRVSDEEYDIRRKYLNIKQYPNETDEIINAHNNLKLIETDKSGLSNGYPYFRNYDYLKEKMGTDKANKLNKPSDYGFQDIEGFAECGGMVINGFRSPDNPKAVVRWDDGTIQYREWVKLHPYFAQYLVKQVYDEDVSIDYLLGQSITTERNKFLTDE